MSGGLPELDPQVAAFVQSITGRAGPLDTARSSLADVRRRCEEARARWAAGGPQMEHTGEHLLPLEPQPVRIRHYVPVRASGAALVYLHGGGWTLFSLDTHDRLMREYASRAGIAVVGVDYALSPEAKFPVALEQVAGVLRWLAQHGPRLGIDPGRLAVGGDSSGANLAVAAALKLRDAGDRSLRGLLLNYGAFDVHCDAESARRFGGEGNMLTAREMQEFWSNYLGSPADASDPLACPLRAVLAGLPPAFLAVAECDLLAAQNLEMAARLEAAGVPVRAIVYPGASHSFLEAVSVAAVSDRALDDAARWLERELAK